MPNPEHLQILEQGVEAWNTWRKQNTDIRPDLSRAPLRMTNLTYANLSWVNFRAAELWGVNFTKANLSGANLSNAFL